MVICDGDETEKSHFLLATLQVENIAENKGEGDKESRE
jgi:hypothetical protein